MERWLVIIARDRPELWVTWASFYGGAEKVEVLLDRRQEQPGTKRKRWNGPERRTQPNRDTALRECGHLVIPRPALAPTSR
ncbi:MAG: hypothetical protein H6Q86_2670 [candidate division NC10 bacterium]|jgi:hypothetical protein|nr:hypothetical protein [candidate division NC10 bacterium]